MWTPITPASRSTEIASSRNSVVLPSMANARLKRERRSTRKSSASATDLAVLWVAPAEILAYSPSFEVPSDGGGSASIVSLLCRSSSAAVAAASIALRGNGSTNERELAAALAAASRRFRSATTCASAPATSTASSSARPCWEGTVPATCASSSVTHNPADKRRRRAPAAVLSSENELRRRERDGVGAETPIATISSSASTGSSEGAHSMGSPLCAAFSESVNESCARVATCARCRALKPPPLAMAGVHMSQAGPLASANCAASLGTASSLFTMSSVIG
mmetsp:Transcript_31237/g.95545  ORF Transcript_31237/g.95545 Transcript_31237/m.95545 type:complete len:279 (-) Transcript_31237:682-1518(-)